MPMFTAKHYRFIADTMAGTSAELIDKAAKGEPPHTPGGMGVAFVMGIANAMKEENPRFDTKRFVNYYLDAVRNARKE